MTTPAGDVQAFQRCIARSAGSRISSSSRTWSELGAGLVLAHGAGSNSNSPLLITVAGSVRRCWIDCAALRSSVSAELVLTARRDRGTLNAIVMGSGMRLRRCGNWAASECFWADTLTVDGRLRCCAPRSLIWWTGCCCFLIRLHPPRKPEQLRVQHLPELRVPALFVHGTRDPFGSVEEMEAAMKMIPAKTELLKSGWGGA